MTGATTFRIDAGLDTGDILATLSEEIRPTDTADDLLTRLAHRGGDLLVQTMDGLEAGQITPAPQQGAASYAGKISTPDARIAWDAPAEVVDRHIRAHTPGPGAWTTLAGDRIKVGPLPSGIPEPVELPALSPGALSVHKSAIYVGTGTRPVALGQIQPPGKKMMNAADWARGVQLDEEVSFE